MWWPLAWWRTVIWGAVSLVLWYVQRHREDMRRLRTQVVADYVRTQAALEEAAKSLEAQDALLEDRKARALAAMLRIMDVGTLPRRARRNYRTWKVKSPYA
jgi:hypothetical protein